MELAEELRACLHDLSAGGTIEIRENGGRIPSARPLSWEVRGAPAKPLLHLWSETCNVTRRVLAITDQSEGRVLLAVECFGRTKPQRLEIIRLGYERDAKGLSREEFCEQLRRILVERFPDETLERVSIAADLEHSLSRVYARGISRKGMAHYAFLAVPDEETPDALESSLTYGLLWLDRTRQTGGGGNLSGLRLILPKGKAAELAARIHAIDPRLTVQVYERDAQRETLERVDPCADGNINTWLVPRRESQLLLDRAAAAIAPLQALEPDAIRAHAAPQLREVILRFRGLAFGRWSEGRVTFGMDGHWDKLNADSEIALKQLVLNLQNFRHPLASDTRHPLYRAQAERWMQMLAMGDVSQIDLALDPTHVYEQVFAQTAGQRGVLDLLCVTRAHRLAILELKTVENPDLPLQAGEYWSRICRLQAQGDLARYGYFPGIELHPDPPIVYLVAPALRFHPSTDVLLRYLKPEMEIIRVGLVESWRRGLRVVMRQ
ncbi:MAG: hypothetical protein WAN12_05680 [Candidatus Acidiferrum sp.]